MSNIKQCSMKIFFFNNKQTSSEVGEGNVFSKQSTQFWRKVESHAPV